MTKSEAIQEFEEQHLSQLVESFGTDDGPAFAEAWNNFTDNLHRNGDITTWQLSNWLHPKRFHHFVFKRLTFRNPAA